jgi:hypothetical protein
MMAMGKNHMVGDANVADLYIVVIVTLLFFYTFLY